MSGLLMHRSRPSRSIAFAGIVALHAGALALGLAARDAAPESAEEPEPIRVSLLTDSRPPAAPRPTEVVLRAPAAPLLIPTPMISLPPDPPVTTPGQAAVTPAPEARASAPEADTGGSAPVVVAEVDYLQLPKVVYPPAARRARAQGLVHVRALVDEEGRPAEVSVARSSGFELLDGAACKAVRGALFKPYRRNNVAHRMVVIVPIEFSINTRG